MITPVRLRLLRVKGWRLQEASRAINGLPAHWCCRPGQFGNPFTARAAREAGYSADAAPAAAVAEFRRWLDGDAERDYPQFRERRARLLSRLPALVGHNLACFCAIHRPCHCDVLLPRVAALEELR